MEKTKKQKSNSRLIEDFKNDSTIQKSRSKKTTKEYVSYVKRFLERLKRPAREASEGDILAFLAELKNRNVTNKTISVARYSLVAFFRDFLEMDITKVQIPVIKKTKKTYAKGLSPKDVKKIISVTKLGRNRLIVKFLYLASATVSETAGLKLEDLNFKECSVELKGRKIKRTAPLPEPLVRDIDKYLKRKKTKSKFVFSKVNGKRISTDTVQRIVKRSAKRAGMPPNTTSRHLQQASEEHKRKAGVNTIYREISDESVTKSKPLNLGDLISDSRLLRACKTAFNGKDYGDAILHASIHLEVRIREKSKSTANDFGKNLITKVLKQERGILKSPTCKTVAEEEGLYFLNRGIIQFHKNAKSHREIDMEKENALKIIGYIDYLLKILSECESRERL